MKAQPHDQLQPEVTQPEVINTNYNNWRIFFHIFIQHLHDYYLVVLHFLFSIFGLPNRV